MPTPTVTQVILQGMQRRGLSPSEIAAMIRARGDTFKKLTTGQKELTYRHREAIERETGFSVGQFACLVLEPEGGEFSSMIDSLVDLTPIAPTPKRMVRRQPVKA